MLVQTADLFGWVPDVANWLGGHLAWVAVAIAWIGAEFEWVADAVDWLAGAAAWVGGVVASLFTWIWEVTDPISAGVRASIAAAAGVIVLALFVRKVRLLLLARLPKVQISQFTWADPSEDSEAVWITSLFHDQLAALEADPLDPLPERAPSAPFVDIVEGVARGTGQKPDLADAVGRMLRALWPVAAYEVWGTLRPLPDGGRISVQLIDRARGNRTLGSKSHRRGEWEQGARDAAMTVAGILYPRVAGKHRGPWVHWKETVPTQLITAHHEAQTFEDDNRFEEAMGAYHRALEHDPMNPHLRLRIATLQERLGLYIDAWVTYRAIVDEPKWRAWKGPDRRARLIALYRLAILLSNGHTAEQWVKNDSLKGHERNLRDEERVRRRKELRMALKQDSLLYKRELYVLQGPAFASSSGLLSALRPADRKTDEARREWVASVFGQGEENESEMAGKNREQTVNAVLQVLALRRLEELDAWLRARPPLRMRQWGAWIRRRPRTRSLLRRRELARGAVRVSKLLVRIRIAADAERLAGSNVAELTTVRREHRWLILRWPFPANSAFRKVLHFVAPRRRWGYRRADAWQLHYNAACTAASVLLDGSVLNNAKAGGEPAAFIPDEREIVKRAVRELEEYAFRAGAGRVAAQADWVASGDPDLQGLTNREEFKLWASHYLPRDLPGRRLRGNVDINRYTTRIVQEAALVFGPNWRVRADLISAPAIDAVYWWLQERAAWSELGKACFERGSWQQRLKAIKTLQDWLRSVQRPYEINFAHETRDDIEDAPEARRKLLEQTAALIDGYGSGAAEAATVSDWVASRASHVQAAHERGASAIGERGLVAGEEKWEALRAARLWARVADAFGAGLKEDGTTEPATLLQPIRDVLAEPGPDIDR